jgi:hypothetical protein
MQQQPLRNGVAPFGRKLQNNYATSLFVGVLFHGGGLKMHDNGREVAGDSITDRGFIHPFQLLI